MHAGHVESDGSLDVVPWVTVTTLEPRDHSVVQLQVGDRLGGLHHFVGAQNTFDVRNSTHDGTSDTRAFLRA